MGDKTLRWKKTNTFSLLRRNTKETEYWSSLPVTSSVLFHFIVGGREELIHGMYMDTRGYFIY